MKYSGKNSSLNGPLKICVSHDLRKKYSIFTLIFVFMSLRYILFQMVCLFSKDSSKATRPNQGNYINYRSSSNIKYGSALILQNLPCPEKVLVARQQR